MSCCNTITIKFRNEDYIFCFPSYIYSDSRPELRKDKSIDKLIKLLNDSVEIFKNNLNKIKKNLEENKIEGEYLLSNIEISLCKYSEYSDYLCKFYITVENYLNSRYINGNMIELCKKVDYLKDVLGSELKESIEDELKKEETIIKEKYGYILGKMVFFYSSLNKVLPTLKIDFVDSYNSLHLLVNDEIEYTKKDGEDKNEEQD